MKTIAASLAAFGAIALLAFAPTAPVRAEAESRASRSQWHDHEPQKSPKRRRGRKRQRIESGAAQYRYFGADPDRYFGVGPGSYDCYGYDCNW